MESLAALRLYNVVEDMFLNKIKILVQKYGFFPNAHLIDRMKADNKSYVWLKIFFEDVPDKNLHRSVIP